MLIKCPECGKEISDQSKQCIHCGFPLVKNHICTINGKECDLSFVLDMNYSYAFKVRDFIQITHCDISISKKHIDQMIDIKTIPKYLNIPVKKQEDNQPKCPHCNSTRIQPISGTERAISVLGLGLMSKKLNKSFKCLDCKYTW